MGTADNWTVIIALVMAMDGRKPAARDLHGEGVATLQSRR
jgi:hypothetical protein